MKFKLPKMLNQTGSLYLVLLGLVAVVVIGAILVGVTMVSDAASQPAKPAAKAPAVIKDVAYGSDPLQKLNISASKNANSPIVVLVHGC